MKMRLASLALLATAAMLPLAANAASNQNNPYPNAKPMFVTLPNHMNLAPKNPPANLAQWNGSFTDLKGHKITYTMVGADPSASNVTTTITVLLIPIKMVYGSSNGNMTFNPKNFVLPNGKTVEKNTLVSPLFQAGIDFVQGGTDLGTDQYEDAFQRGNFWSSVSTNTSYHTVLKAVKEPLQTINVSSAQGKVIPNPFGSGVVGTMDINAFDGQLQTFIHNIAAVNPSVLPLFLTYDIYLTSGGCCIGGYHSANGNQPTGQTYSYATYVDHVGSFSQDVSALSHELGEWYDDPFVDNHVNCNDNSIMEDGDPLEGGPNYGAYKYTLHGFSYNLQSLVFIGYFGAPRSTSVNSWLAFQNDENNVCPGQ